MMSGLLNHLWLTLKLNFRSMQAIIYGYLVPIFFLFAFGGVFRSDKPPLVHEIGQLLTVTILGGACFGMPTAMVSERERGVWRRYRLLPAAIGGIITSAMVARLLIVAGAAALQMALAYVIFGTPFNKVLWPQFIAAFVLVTFSFLGLGLVIAMLADTVPAVQALGQAIFLPMIMVGGVGVPLNVLPPWAQQVAGFFPGRYAVEVLQATYRGGGLHTAQFAMLALTIIGLAALLTGAKLFRWDVGQRIAPPARAWVSVALLAWVGVGLAAKQLGKLKPVASSQTQASLVDTIIGRGHAGLPATLPSSPTTVAIASPTTLPATNPAENSSAPAVNVPDAWFKVTDAQINSITYDDLPDDGGAVTPMAASLDGLDQDTQQRLDDLESNLLDWRPAQVADVGQRVRNLLYVCAIPDIAQDLLESYIPLVVLDEMKMNIQHDELIKALAYVALKPDGGTVITNIKELGFEGDMPDETVRERAQVYARKFLFRLLGKDKQPQRSDAAPEK